MDYSILKNLEPPPSYFMPLRRFTLPSNPHLDYINPGVGFATKIFDFYVPLHAQSFHYQIKKKNTIEPLDGITAEEQKGTGEIDEEMHNNESEIHQTPLQEIMHEKEEVPFKNKKRLSEGVFESFMHPKIKTAKFHFEKNNTIVKKSKKSQKNEVHKFNVV